MPVKVVVKRSFFLRDCAKMRQVGLNSAAIRALRSDCHGSDVFLARQATGSASSPKTGVVALAQWHSL